MKFLKNLAYLFCILTIFIVVLLFIFQNSFITMYKNDFFVKEYNSISTNPEISKQFIKNFDNKISKKYLKEFDISFDFKINNVKDNNVVFRTAETDEGIKFEIKKDYQGNVVVYPAKSDRLLEFPVSSFSPNKWYSIKIVHNLKNEYKIYLDKELKFSQETNSPELINKIAVGGEFSGEIKNFNIKYRIVKPANKLICKLIYLPFILLILLTLIKLIKDFSPKDKIFNEDDIVYLVLLNLYPIIYMYLSNINELMFIEFIKISIFSIFCVTALYLILFKLIARGKLFLLMTVLIFFFYMPGHILNYVEKFITISGYSYLTAVYSILTVITALIIFSNKKMETMIKPIKIMTLLLIIMSILSNTKILISHFNLILKNTSTKNAAVIEKDDVALPDIYFIIFDGYINSNAAKKYCGFDNSVFINSLQARGFYIAEDSMSNYGHTMFSIPSMLNYNYLQTLGVKNGELAKEGHFRDLFINNPLINEYAVKKYNVHVVNLENQISANFKSECKSYSLNPEDIEFNLKNLILLKSILLFNDTGKGIAHRKAILKSFEILKNISKEKGNKFIYSHILSPHAPYVFSKNGELPAIKDRDEIFGKDYVEPNYKSYFNQLEYLNKKIIELFDKIIKNEPNSVVIFISDHGLYPDKKYPTTFDSFLYNDEEYYMRSHNLEAVYFPDKDYSKLYRTITPINLVRVLLNKYFDTNLKMLEDKHYFNNGHEKFEPEPVLFN